MNLTLRQHFDAIETCLLESPAIVSYRILSQGITTADGKLRVTAATSNGGGVLPQAAQGLRPNQP
jgi:hypothetical protein